MCRDNDASWLDKAAIDARRGIYRIASRQSATGADGRNSKMNVKTNKTKQAAHWPTQHSV